MKCKEVGLDILVLGGENDTIAVKGKEIEMANLIINQNQ